MLLGVLAALLLCYFGLDKWNAAQEKKEAEKAKSETIKVETLDEIAAIAYTYNDADFSFQKEDGTWKYTPDPKFPLEQSYVETMEDTFTNLTALRELKDGDSLSAYGLEEPAYTISLTGKDGTKLSLYLGNTAEDNYYMTLGDKTKVYTVGSSILSCIQYDLNAMMENDSFPVIGSDSVKSVSIETKNGSKQETEEYDAENEEDKDKISVIAGGLGAVKLTDCADYYASGEEEKSYGLDEASRTVVSVAYENGDEEENLLFYIGGTEGENRYVQMDGSHIVYRVSSETIKNVLGTETAEAK